MDIHNNSEDSRFEVDLGDGLALIQYRLRGDRISLIHTEVPPAHQGQGIADQLAKYALEWSGNDGFAVLPYCPFVRAYIARHPEYERLVAADFPR